MHSGISYLCKNLVNMPKNLYIIKTLKSRLQDKLGSDLQKVILFGSRLKESVRKDSDYDVLIILNTQLHWKTKDLIREICFEISLENDVFIDSKIISDGDLKTKFWGKHPLLTDAIKNGIHA